MLTCNKQYLIVCHTQQQKGTQMQDEQNNDFENECTIFDKVILFVFLLLSIFTSYLLFKGIIWSVDQVVSYIYLRD